MKKLLNIFLIFSILLTNFFPVYLIKADECVYQVKIIRSNGNNEDVACFNNYNEAKTNMLNYNSDELNVAVIYSGGKIINAKYAIAKLKPGYEPNMYVSASATGRYTYISTSYGSDAAFVDYDVESKRALIKISGFQGWIHSDYVEIVPIVNIMQPSIILNKPYGNSKVRTEPTTNDSIGVHIGYVTEGSIHTYYEKRVAEGYTWYRIKYNNQDGWIASQSNWTSELSNGLNTYYQAWGDTGNLLHYFEHQINGYVSTGSFNNLATYPSFMERNGIYYSFDGNYFYKKITDMLDDYRNNTYSKSLNPNNPHFPYYMYLPNHSKTGYTANDFNQAIVNKGFYRGPDPSVKYIDIVNRVDGNGNPYLEGVWNDSISRSGISLLYNQGNSLVSVANKYGVNALLMFSTALNESSSGTSAIAFAKNNLFGINATDTNPFTNAKSYNSVYDSMEDFAILTGTKYSDPNHSNYHGSHYGNKVSGLNIMYASDPYWGEKQANHSRSIDKDFGANDYNANTIGVKLTDEEVSVHKEPNGSSSVIYKMRNKYDLVKNMPLIVFDKVLGNDGKYWYKVYTDASLDEYQNLSSNPYTFERSYGFIESSKFYVANNQPVINASNIVIKQYETANILNNVTATDVEDGNITGSIIVSGGYDNTTVGDYSITYTVEDNNRFSVSKTVTLTVVPADKPQITVPNKAIPQFTTFDPLSGVKATDYIDGDITNKIEVISNNVDTTKIGEYKVTYKVVNSKNSETVLDVIVRVIANQKPVIKADNQTISLGSTFSPLNYATATDLEDGDITNKVEVIYNDVNTSVPGRYKVTYQVTDNALNVTTLDIYVTVEEINYTKTRGEFYFEKMDFNNNTNKLEVVGYLAITGMNNTRDTNIKYDMIFKNNYNNTEIIKPLERWLDGNPSRSYSDGVYNYSATWFKGSIDISDLSSGEYTLYVRARSGTLESVNLFRNIFEKNMAKKVQTSNGKGFVFRNNNYLKDYPIELVVSDKGLITSVMPPNSSNMFNSYRSLSFDNKYLNIIGSSYNVGANYGSNTNITRELIFENISTGNRYTYDIGSYVGTDIPLRVPDGFSKVRGWFNTTGKIDISIIEKGKYIIYIRTKTDNVDDHGELNDIFLKEINATTNVGNKKYRIELNKNFRFRLELIVE